MYDKTRGIWMGVAAVVLWSATAVLVVLGGQRVGAWQFVAISSLIGGVVQVIYYAAVARMPLRALLCPPLRAWLAIGGLLVVYLLAITNALVLADPAQKVGVSLVNYLWPTLTVVLALVLVPGTRGGWPLAAAAALSLAGIGVGNWDWLASLRQGAHPGPGGLSMWAYVLGAVAAVTWALYSALIARWRGWINAYATAPLGFLLSGLAAAIIGKWRGQWSAMDAGEWLSAIFYGLGPCAAGYLLWELALHRAPPTTLGLLGSATPVLSTLWLCVLFLLRPATQQAPVAAYGYYLTGAALVGAGVLLGAYSGGKAQAGGERPNAPMAAVTHTGQRA
jgi:drug/metabolite transporter (DMT)-like permease